MSTGPRRGPWSGLSQRIARHIPGRWADVCGSPHIVSYLRRAARKGGCSNLFLRGRSRSGKTALVKLFAKAVGCPHPTPEGDPCNGCAFCRDFDARSPSGGLFAEIQGDGARLHFAQLDGSNLDGDNLRETMLKLPDVDDRVVLIDEAFRLSRYGMDEKLFKLVEERSAIWIACSVDFRGIDGALLDPQFVNRFQKRFVTREPSAEELARWLLARCREWGLAIRRDALKPLLKKSRCLPGHCLELLAQAADDEGVVTREMVEEHDFAFSPRPGPWPYHYR